MTGHQDTTDTTDPLALLASVVEAAERLRGAPFASDEELDAWLAAQSTEEPS